MDLLRPIVFFYRPKAISKVAIIKAKSATIAFFSSPPFLLLALAFSPFFTVCYYDFGASRSLETCLLKPFHSIDLQISLGWFSKNRQDVCIN